jgi:lactate dehydrogenase-like 2-hydroxyacid dehydrogenase
MTDKLLKIGRYNDQLMERLNLAFDVIDLRSTDVRRLTEIGPEISYVMTNGHDGVRPDIMDQLPNLRAISCYGVGYDGVDVATCAARKVPLSHTPDVLNAEVASTAVMLMLACYRNLLVDDAYVRAGHWKSKGNAPLSRSAENRTVGIVGLGRIGHAIAQKLGAFDARVVYHSRTEKANVPYQYYADLERMARDVDVMICITPGGPATSGLISAKVIDALGPEGMLINVSRGSVVDQSALVSALQDGRLGYAGLDVFDDEPNVPSELFGMQNVVLLPHAGSATVETRAAMGNLTVDNLLEHQKTGKLLTPVPECAHL